MHIEPAGGAGIRPSELVSGRGRSSSTTFFLATEPRRSVARNSGPGKRLFWPRTCEGSYTRPALADAMPKVDVDQGGWCPYWRVTPVLSAWQVMQRCWALFAAGRPPCQRLKTHLQDALSAAQAQEKVSQCVVCLDAPASHALLPCGHRRVCAGCAETMSTCPICRGGVQGSVRIFDS